jgi:GH15 family glucan-1,4-alpha-glucosidase
MCCSGGTTKLARLFERLLALHNDVGLLAEEYDPHSGRQLGNFPQAFSHLAVNAAHTLGTAAGAARLRSQKSEPFRRCGSGA